MSKHTPGPWRYDPERGIVVGQPHDHPQDKELGIKTAQSAPVVCFVRGYHGSQEADENGAILGNALRLREINAELLEALEEIAGCIHHNTGGTQGAIRDRARAAIAKAKS